MAEIKIPLSVPNEKRSEYKKNYQQLTNFSGHLLLVAGDQKVEHLNDDFFGSHIDPSDNSPEHLFKVATAIPGAAFATHLGLIERYGDQYRSLPYIVKLNGKTNLGVNEEKDSSKLWWKIEDIIKFKKQSGLKIVGIGYTIYLGGKYEAKMLAKAAQAIFKAQQAGLTTVIWVYPRGLKINEENIHIIAGGAGVVAALGADFVKVKYPYNLKNKQETAKKFVEVTTAAGKTKVVCVGSEKMATKEILNYCAAQIKTAQTSGLAIGRNLHQRSLAEASQLGAALGAIIFKKTNAAEAWKIYNQTPKKPLKKSSRFLGIF